VVLLHESSISWCILCCSRGSMEFEKKSSVALSSSLLEACSSGLHWPMACSTEHTHPNVTSVLGGVAPWIMYVPCLDKDREHMGLEKCLRVLCHQFKTPFSLCGKVFI